MRLLGIGFMALLLGACGGGGTSTNEDAGMPAPQTGSASAPAAADFSCVGSSTDCDLPGLRELATCPPDPGFTVSGIVEDFQAKENIVTAVGASAVATVTVYETTADTLNDVPLAGPVQTDSSGRYTVTIDKSLTRLIFKTTMDNSKDTYEFGQLIIPNQTDADRYSISNATGDFINAWVGVAWDTSKGAVAGALRDCQQLEVAGAIGHAVDEGGVDVVPESQVFYFNDAAGLPTKRSKRTWSDFDGRMLFLNVPPTTGGVRIQAFVTLNGDGTLTKVAENTVPVLANSIVITDLDPLGPQ
jgi:hypothetical protein